MTVDGNSGGIQMPKHRCLVPFYGPEVIIQDEESKKEYEVVGRFPLVGPWWAVNVKVKKMGSKYFVQGYPSYFLRTDIEENNQQVFSLFLKECDVPDFFKQEFFTWLPRQPTLSFRKLEEKLKQFQVSYLEKGKKQGDTKNFDIFQYVLKSFAGKAVLVAMNFPMIMEFLPVLLPRHFCCLLEEACWQKETENNSDADVEKERFQDDILTKLNDILKNEPWKLGFSKITYRELNLSYCEATWAAFCQCKHLLWKIPELQKNALILYDRLKKQCREMGHTYEDQDELTRFVSKDMSIEHAWQSLEFLKDQHIVIREKKMVFLPHLYNSEKDIAMYIGDLLSNHSWKLDVDVRQILNVNVSETSREIVDIKMNVTQVHEMEYPKENSPENHDCENSFLKKQVESTSGTRSKAEVDLDQVTAMEKICSNPVTIISGKGGCGKSTIVSCLFCHLKQMEKEVEAASKDFEGDLDASEEWNTFSHHWESENTCTKNLLNVLFTAPTGRAASLLSEKTRFPAYTLHQIIYSFKSWKQSQQGLPWKFSTVTILVVDEGSLVSVHILSLVLKLLCEHAQLAKLIILGDTRQLPSIDPGNMLADVFEGLKSKGLSVELRTNHRAESQLIVDNATRISHRKLPEFDEVLKVSGWNEELTMPSPEKKFIFIALPSGGGCDNLQTAIKTLLKKGPGLQDARQSQFIAFRRKQRIDISGQSWILQEPVLWCLVTVQSSLEGKEEDSTAWRNPQNTNAPVSGRCLHPGYLEAQYQSFKKEEVRYLQTAIKTLLKKGPGLQDARQSQFIAFRRQDCDLINELCCQHYSNHLTRVVLSVLNIFKVFNLAQICCMRNIYLKDLLPSRGFSQDPDRNECKSGNPPLAAETIEEGKRLCNGDIFFIADDVEINKQRLLTISSTYGSTFTVVYKALKKLCHIKHAWARTIHTFQGSEEKTVVYVVGNPGRQHWQHVYTAVTRGRCRVYVIAEEMHLKKAVTNKNIPRKTRLQKYLRETIAEINNHPKQTSPLKKSWQNQELETQSVSVNQDAPDPSEPVTDSIKQEGSVVLNEEQTSNSQQISPYKRQRSLTANLGDVMKTSLTNERDSPLVSSRLKNLTLEHVTPRKLFKS
nr:PREDICTED: DNA helicase B [Apteryx mantelli mantelli]